MRFHRDLSRIGTFKTKIASTVLYRDGSAGEQWRLVPEVFFGFDMFVDRATDTAKTEDDRQEEQRVSCSSGAAFKT